MTQLELRGGNCSVIKNGIVMGGANTCLNAIVVRAWASQPKVTEHRALVTFAVGTSVEAVVFQWLKDAGKNVKSDVHMEEEITEHVKMSGHADSVEKLEDGSYLVYEFKTVSSTSVAKKVFKERHYKPDNLAQLVGYMVTAEAEQGKLVYTSTIYTTEKGRGEEFKVAAGDQAIFDVRITPTGEILVDNEPAPFCVEDVLRFRDVAARVIERQVIGSEPPTGWDGNFFSPCKDCWLQEHCEAFKEHGDTDLFFENVNKHLDRVGRR
jgi:hypothetical protein